MFKISSFFYSYLFITLNYKRLIKIPIKTQISPVSRRILVRFGNYFKLLPGKGNSFNSGVR